MPQLGRKGEGKGIASKEYVRTKEYIKLRILIYTLGGGWTVNSTSKLADSKQTYPLLAILRSTLCGGVPSSEEERRLSEPRARCWAEIIV